MFWNRAAETADREELEELQLRRLREVVARCTERVRLYRNNLSPNTAERLTSLDDLDMLPFTTKDQLRDAYPFGMLAVPREELARVHASSGTKGKPTVVGYTRHDIDVWAEVCARALAAAGAQIGDVVHNAYGYGLFTGGLGLHYGAEKLGCTVVPASGGNTPRQVLLITDFSARILCCTPSYALNIADTMAASGIDPRENPLAYGIFGAEPWSEGLRDEIEKRLGIRALDIYGLSEIIGPGRGQRVHRAGRRAHQRGPLPGRGDRPRDARGAARRRARRARLHDADPEATPVLRYRTRRSRLGDPRAVRLRADAGPHEPGHRPHRRHAGGARGQRLPVGGRGGAARGRGARAVLPAAARPAAGAGRAHRGGRGRQHDLDHELLAAAAARRLDRALGLACEVRVLDEGQVPRSEGKALRVLDERER